MTPDRLGRFAPIPLRLMLGFGFAVHGYPKLFTAQGHESFVGMLGGLGIPAPEVTSYLVGGLEFFGGIALILGVWVAAVSALAAVEMLVAAFLVHLPAGFDFMNITGTGAQGPEFGMPGYEVPLLYFAGFVSLVLSGAGALSVTGAGAARPATTVREARRRADTVGAGLP